MKIIDNIKSFAWIARRVDDRKGVVSVLGVIRHGICYFSNRMKRDITCTDYFELSFFNKTDQEKDEYITAKEQTRLARTVDSTSIGRYFTRKETLLRIFEKQIGREQLPTGCMSYDEFLSFVSRHEKFLYKPDAKWSGEGIRLIDTKDYQKPMYDLYLELIRERGILDELIVQHSLMSKLNGSSVNTIRVVSFRINRKVELIGAAVRIGRNGKVVDNFDYEGIACSLDLETGAIRFPGEDRFSKRYDTHPDSGTKLVGFRVPNWEKVIALVNEAAAICPIHYVGWDVAVREDDAVLVEANYDPHLNNIQIAGGGGKKRICERLLASYIASETTTERRRSPI